MSTVLIVDGFTDQKILEAAIVIELYRGGTRELRVDFTLCYTAKEASVCIDEKVPDIIILGTCCLKKSDTGDGLAADLIEQLAHKASNTPTEFFVVGYGEQTTFEESIPASISRSNVFFFMTYEDKSGPGDMHPHIDVLAKRVARHIEDISPHVKRRRIRQQNEFIPPNASI